MQVDGTINDQTVTNLKEVGTRAAAMRELRLSSMRMNRGRIATSKAGEWRHFIPVAALTPRD